MLSRESAMVVMMCAWLAVGLLGVGCASGDTSGGERASLLDRVVGGWTLSEIEGQEAASQLGAGMRPPELTFAADGSVGGFSGVNRLSGKVDPALLARGELAVGPIAMTKMAGPPEAMDMERRFTRALEASNSLRIDPDGRLVLSRGDEAILKFVRAAE